MRSFLFLAIFIFALQPGELSAFSIQNLPGPFYGKTCESKTSSRGLASIKSKDPNLKKSFRNKKLNLSKIDTAKTRQVDVDKDGKVDCTREFHKNSRKVKKETCDMTGNGVVDSLSVYDKKGLLVKEYTNRDSDKYFEVAVFCKDVKGEPGLALCKKEVDITGKNKRTEKMYFHKYSPSVYKRYYSKLLKKKKSSRGIASVKSKSKYDEWESQLPVGIGYEWTLQKGYDAHGKGSYFKDLYKAKIDSWNSEKRQFMKYFMSFDDYMPNMYNSCLEDGRSQCRVDSTYTRAGLEGNYSNFALCMNTAFHHCNDDRGKSEGKFCLGCFTDDEYLDMLDATYADEKMDFGEAPEGFTFLRSEEVLIHDSCLEFIDIESFTLEGTTKCWESTEVDDGDWDTTDPLTLNAKIQGHRIYRNLRPTLYSDYATKFDSTSRALPKGVPKSWKIEKKMMQQAVKETGYSEVDEKGDPRIKFFCSGKFDSPDAMETVHRNFACPHLSDDDALVFSPPAVYFNPSKIKDLRYKYDKEVKSDKAALNKYLKERFAHQMAHIMGHSHGYPRKIVKGPNKGKWRCNWTPEPDYAYLCEEHQCAERNVFRGKDTWKNRCSMKPGDHLDPGTGDIIDNGSFIAYSTNNKKKGSLVNDPVDCP